VSIWNVPVQVWNVPNLFGNMVTFILERPGPVQFVDYSALVYNALSGYYGAFGKNLPCGRNDRKFGCFQNSDMMAAGLQRCRDRRFMKMITGDTPYCGNSGGRESGKMKKGLRKMKTVIFHQKGEPG
jgi:hypothetical protein